MESQETDLHEQLDRLETLGNQWLNQVNRTATSNNTIGNATIVVQAGGFFALVLFFVVSVTLGITIAMSLSVYSRMSKIETKQDEQSQYLNAIYMMAPQLKPKGSNHE
jgi:tetrahydromethanopterin S-methyltransferase subunit B